MTRISSVEAARCGLGKGRPVSIGDANVHLGSLQRKNLKAMARARYCVGQSLVEIGEALKISPLTIKKWLWEAKK